MSESLPIQKPSFSALRLSDELMDILTEIFNIGSGRASSVLSEMLGVPIELEIPNLYALAPQHLEEFQHGQKDSYVAVTQQMHGEVEGTGVLSFPLVNGKTLIDNLLSKSTHKSDFGAFESEAIMEVGNIIINAVGSALSDVLKVKVRYDIPELHYTDFPIPYFEHSPSRKRIYCLSFSRFKVRTMNIEGIINFVFCYSNLEVFEQFFSSNHKTFSCKFGEIALEESIITQEQLNYALALQQQSSSFIGEILLHEGCITQEQKDKVIQHHKYQDHTEKFGELLINERSITQEQLTQALKKQEESRQYMGNLLGEILQKLSFISKEEKEAILKKQHIESMKGS